MVLPRMWGFAYGLCLERLWRSLWEGCKHLGAQAQWFVGFVELEIRTTLAPAWWVTLGQIFSPCHGLCVFPMPCLCCLQPQLAPPFPRKAEPGKSLFPFI